MRKCPACQDVIMLAFADPRSKLEIDSCPECFGLWFDSEELRVFFESPDLSQRILEEDAVVGAGRVPNSGPTRGPASSGGRCCPACREPLFESKIGHIHVDYCLGCRGIWLDRSELEEVVTAFLAGERGNLLIVNQLVEGLGTPNRPNPKAKEFLETLDRYRDSLKDSNPRSSQAHG